MYVHPPDCRLQVLWLIFFPSLRGDRSPTQFEWVSACSGLHRVHVHWCVALHVGPSRVEDRTNGDCGGAAEQTTSGRRCDASRRYGRTRLGDTKHAAIEFCATPLCLEEGLAWFC